MGKSCGIEEYLETELHSKIHHEYLGGIEFEIPEASPPHNLIVQNLASALRREMAHTNCRVSAGDMKARLQLFNEEALYHPDIMATSDPQDTERLYFRFPVTIIEVSSPSTERTDRWEKYLSYTQIKTLEEYVLVSENKVNVTVFRRSNRWRQETFSKRDQLLQLALVDFSMPLSSIYEGIALAQCP